MIRRVERTAAPNARPRIVLKFAHPKFEVYGREESYVLAVAGQNPIRITLLIRIASHSSHS
jgi:hypothetical protein